MIVLPLRWDAAPAPAPCGGLTSHGRPQTMDPGGVSPRSRFWPPSHRGGGAAVLVTLLIGPGAVADLLPVWDRGVRIGTPPARAVAPRRSRRRGSGALVSWSRPRVVSGSPSRRGRIGRLGPSLRAEYRGLISTGSRPDRRPSSGVGARMRRHLDATPPIRAR